MGFHSVNFYGFRNIEDTKIDLQAENIYFIGENGQGKTNILEALYLLSYGASFRTQKPREFIKWGQRNMSLSASFNTPEERAGTLGLRIKDGIKTIHLHGKAIKDRKILLKRIPVIAFVHDDFHFSSGPPERRRRFIDQTLSLYDPLYVDQIRSYKKIMQERNHLLRSRNTQLLAHYSEHLALTGLAVMKRREQMIREFGKIFTSLYKEVSEIEEDVNLSYKPSWGNVQNTEEALKVLKQKEEIDLAHGVTNTGPHRDRILYIAAGRDFSNTASTGQRRLLSLVLRIAQAQFLLDTTGRKPLLLLDDVLLEIDPRRRRLFRERLPECEQVFFTFLQGEQTGDIGKNSRTYEVKEGKFYEK